MVKSKQIVDIFPTPIMVAEVEEAKVSLIEKEIISAQKEMEMVEHPDFQNSQFLSTDTFEGNVIDEHSINTLKSVIDELLDDYLKSLGYNEVPEYVMQSWITNNHRNDYGEVHNHGFVDVSGVYYHDTNGMDGDLFFLSPVTGARGSILFNRHSNVMCTPKNGLILLFPPFLNHGVKKNITDHLRISLAFNITFKRK